MSTNNHPCYSPEASANHGRIHLPVARGCNIQCNYCNRLYDCINESRPGVTSAVLSPLQALYYLEKVQPCLDIGITVVGIAGPGDPFADPENTIETLRLIRKYHPDKLLCVATNGLCVAEYAGKLADLGVNHVTLTINAVDPEITAKIVSWVKYKNKMYRGPEAGMLLLERQVLAVKELKAYGITIKINTIVIPGINDTHIDQVSRTMAALGADVINCLPLRPVEGSNFGGHCQPDHETMQKVRWEAAQYLKLVKHCAMCRADAAGRIGIQNSSSVHELLRSVAAMPINPWEKRPYVAVASREGMLINEHLGQAQQFFIYDITDSSFAVLELRKAPERGTGLDRWNELAELLHDCSILLVNQTGEPPRAVLTEAGIKVIVTEGLIDQALSAIKAGSEPVKVLNVKPCTGNGCRGGMC